MLSARTRRAPELNEHAKMAPNSATTSLPIQPEVLDPCQSSWPGEVGCIGNLRNGEEEERWKECQPLKRANNLRPIPLGRTNSSISPLIRTQNRNSPST